MNKIRERIVRKIIDEDEIKEMLELLGCKMIRPKYILPAVVRDRYGKLYTEYTFIKDVCTNEEKKQLVFRKNLSITEDELNEIAHSKRASVIEKRITLPSVWSYEPQEEFLSEHSKVVHRIIGF